MIEIDMTHDGKAIKTLGEEIDQKYVIRIRDC